MSIAIQVPGACLVKVDTGAANALESLGYSRDGVTIRHDGYWIDVKTDDTGGEAGPGSDVQWIGETASISIELTKWDSAVATKIMQRIKGQTTLGTNNTAVGSLMIANSYTFRLVLSSTTLGRNYPTVVLREPMEINLGTKYSTLRIEGQAWTQSGVLFNSTLS